MPKKKSTETEKDGHEKPVVESKEEPSPAAEKPKDEIDEIFATKKRKKGKQVKGEKNAEEEDPKPKKLKKKRKDRGFEESEVDVKPSRPRRRTNDGLAVYSEEELGISRADAGGTPLCPFDCSCCF